jgi:UPF0755 protein
MSPKRKPSSCLAGLVLLTMLLAMAVLAVLIYVPAVARRSFGPPSPSLTTGQRFSYALQLLWKAGDLTEPADVNGAEQLFVVQPGENAFYISQRLEANGLIRSARAFQLYLAWTGMDVYLQTGTYRLSPALTAEAIAGMLQSTVLTEVTFNVLAGWRMEEIAAALPTSGLSITPDEFLAAASNPGLVTGGGTAEGFLGPGSYVLPRGTTASELVSTLIQQKQTTYVIPLEASFAAHGLTPYQAVTLASIVQREAVRDDEMPLIASVFYNRLAAGMRLQSDPTVQYALGYNAAEGTWWTHPLSAADMSFDSSYNTYLYAGLPPGPICSPGPSALGAVANPAASPYYYFQARCDGSGYHNFAETYEGHLQNYCP